MAQLENWRLWSIAYLLLSLLFFVIAISMAHHHSVWWLPVLVAVAFLVMGAKKQPSGK
jgi:hypothetical protein